MFKHPLVVGPRCTPPLCYMTTICVPDFVRYSHLKNLKSASHTTKSVNGRIPKTTARPLLSAQHAAWQSAHTHTHTHLNHPDFVGLKQIRPSSNELRRCS